MAGAWPSRTRGRHPRDFVSSHALVKNPLHESELEWRLQIDHGNPHFKQIECVDVVCRCGLPICTPEAVSELVLGLECQMTVEEGQAILARLNYGNAIVRRIAPADLVA
jgi:hypothetical protein